MCCGVTRRRGYRHVYHHQTRDTYEPRGNGPVVPVLTGQNVPTLDRSGFTPADGLRRGAYVLADAPDGKPALILIASGSEVGLIVAATERLRAEGVAVRCVSMPSWELFDALPQADRDAVLPPPVEMRLAVEMGVAQGWRQYVGDHGAVLSVERFGASAPADVLLREYGFTVDSVCARAKVLLDSVSASRPDAT